MSLTSFRELLCNVGQALKPAPWQLPRSFFGDPASWSVSEPPETEFSLLRGPDWIGTLDTLRQVTIPAWPGQPRGILRALPEVLFRKSDVDRFPRDSDRATAGPGESWLFINGICTDARILELNARMLHRMFGRPLTLLHNQTSGVALDLAECAVGKGWLQVTESVRSLFPALLAELLEPTNKKVVLIAHSQGTILTAIFLDLLRQLAGARSSSCSPEKELAGKIFEPVLFSQGSCLFMNPKHPARYEAYSGDRRPAGVKAYLNLGSAMLALPAVGAEHLKKLEVYAFATCATELRPIRGVPYIEHFANEHDMVAKLGVLAPRAGCGAANIGDVEFEQPGAWGHLLNAHYLAALEQDFLDSASERFRPRPGASVTTSRLYRYWKQNRSSSRGRPARGRKVVATATTP